MEQADCPIYLQSLISDQNVDRIRHYFLDLQSNQGGKHLYEGKIIKDYKRSPPHLNNYFRTCTLTPILGGGKDQSPSVKYFFT